MAAKGASCLWKKVHISFSGGMRNVIHMPVLLTVLYGYTSDRQKLYQGTEICQYPSNCEV